MKHSKFSRELSREASAQLGKKNFQAFHQPSLENRTQLYERLNTKWPVIYETHVCTFEYIVEVVWMIWILI
jgi:hypothetical protein